MAIEDGELGCGGQFGEGGGDAADFVAGRLVVDGVGVQLGFDGPGAAQTPEGGDQFLDDAEFDIVDGAVELDVLVHEDVEAGLVLGGQDHALGEQAVADGVEGRGLFSGGCDGAARAGAVGAGRKNSFEGRHCILCHQSTSRVPAGEPHRAWRK